MQQALNNDLCIRGGTILDRVRLEAESVLGAWYELELYEIEGGYLIRKSSGATNRKINVEIWYRPSLLEAQEKFRRIVAEKTNHESKRRRHYVLVTAPEFREECNGRSDISL